MSNKLDVGRNLYHFYKFIMRPLHQDFTESEHINTLAQYLMDLVKSKYTNLCVAMPPRHSKSSMVTLAFPLWLILNDHSLNIMILNAEHRLCEKFGIELREYIELMSSETGLYLSDVKHSNTHLMFEDEHGVLQKGNIQLHSINGNYTGQDADYIIIDDPYKGFEDITPILLEKKIDLFKTKVLQRREPDTKLIICHTRWHSDDLQGYLKLNSPNEYKFLEFPAILKDGTPLWKDRFDITFLKQQLKEMGERLFSSIYQQQPLDETGDFFNVDKLTFIDDIQLHDHVLDNTVRSYDCAYSDETKGETNDRTASILMSRTRDDKYIIRELNVGRYGEQLFNVIRSTARLDTANIPILIETGTTGGASKALFDIYKDRLTGYNITQSKPITSKVDRAYAFKEAILDGKVIICLPDEQRGQLLQELKGFPLMKRDDIVDALSYAYNYLSSSSGPASVRSGGKRKRRRIR